MIGFQLTEKNLDFAAELNNGVRPILEDEMTYFVWKGKDEVPEILTSAQFWYNYRTWKPSVNLYVSD